jgi:hypothetical protein
MILLLIYIAIAITVAYLLDGWPWGPRLFLGTFWFPCLVFVAWLLMFDALDDWRDW